MSCLQSCLSDENQKSEDSLRRRSRTEEKSQVILEEIYNVAEVRHQSTVPKRVTSTDRHSQKGVPYRGAGSWYVLWTFFSEMLADVKLDRWCGQELSHRSASP